MGDLHYPAIDETVPGLADAHSRFFQSLIEHFLEIDAHMHVSIGDLTNFGHASELIGVYNLLNQRDRNFYHALGNHDLYALPRKDVLTLTGQCRYHTISTDEAIFAFLDTAREMDLEDYGGWIDDEQLQWFENIVQTSGTKPLFVFAHHPVYNTTKNSELDKSSIHPSIDMWKILEQKEGIGVYLNGHTHVDSIVQEKNWTFLQTSACLDQQSFRIIDIEKEEINIASLDIIDKDLTESASIIYNNINYFRHNPNARGQESDRQCRIPLLPMIDQTS